MLKEKRGFGKKRKLGEKMLKEKRGFGKKRKLGEKMLKEKRGFGKKRKLGKKRRLNKINYLSLFVAIFIIAFGGFIIYKEFLLSPSDFELLECTILKQTSENGIGIVFFADNVDIANEYKDYFLSFKPFDEYSEKFNFYYIVDYKPSCELYKGIALFCYSRELLRSASSCQFDYAVIVNDDFEEDIRSSTYMNVISINRKHELSVFPHEFGHAFLNLAEEYVHRGEIPLGAENCVENCAEFDGKEEGCFAGCSDGDYFRSVESGVMRSLFSETYGLFNEGIISEQINKDKKGVITGRAVHEAVACSRENYYLIGVEVSSGVVGEVTERSLVQGCAPDAAGVGGYFFSQVFEDGSRAVIGKFNPELIFTDAPGGTVDEVIAGETLVSGVPFYLQVPVVRGAERLEILDEKKGVVTVVSLEKSEFHCGIIGGDVNGDGRVDVSDAGDLNNYLGGDEGILNCQRNADFDRNGVIGAEDSQAISRKVFGDEPYSYFYGVSPSLSSSDKVKEPSFKGDSTNKPSDSKTELPSVSPSGTASPSPSGTASPSVSPSASPSGTASPSPSGTASSSPSGSPLAFDKKKSSLWARITGWFAKQIEF